MSALNPVLYGKRLYGQETYSENADPVTTTLTIADSVSSTDSPVNDTVNRLLNEVMTATEIALKSVNKPLTDTTVLSDAITKSLAHAFSETLTPTDATITKAINKALLESVTPTDVTLKSINKPLADNLTVSENIAKQVSNHFSESLTPTDLVIHTINKLMPETLTPTDVTTYNVNKPLAENLTLSETFIKSSTRTLSESITPTDLVLHAIRKPMADSIAFTESFVTSFVKYLSDTVTLMDSDQENIMRILTELLSVQDSIITIIFTKGFNEVLLIQDWLSLRLSKPGIWTINVPIVPSNTLYAQTLYGYKLYAGQGGNTTPWNTQQVVQQNPGWKSYNELEEHN